MSDEVKPAALVLLYGKSKLGKTVDFLYAAPYSYVVAVPAAVQGAASVCGYELEKKQILNAPTMIDLIAVLKEARKRPLRGGVTPDAVIVDDFSLIGDQTLAQLERSAGRNGFEMWKHMRNLFLELRVAAREAGLHVLINCHEVTPSSNEEQDKINAATTASTSLALDIGDELQRELLRGGPRVQPKKMVEDLPAICDAVVRVVSTSRPMPSYWPTAIVNDVRRPWVVGDRLNVFHHGLPLNTGEALRASGRQLRRLFPWQEPLVERVAGVFGKLSVGDEVNWGNLMDMAEAFVKKEQPDATYELVKWTVRDALARYQIRARSTAFKRFGV